jgi:hypothetical protein
MNDTTTQGEDTPQVALKFADGGYLTLPAQKTFSTKREHGRNGDAIFLVGNEPRVQGAVAAVWRGTHWIVRRTFRTHDGWGIQAW